MDTRTQTLPPGWRIEATGPFPGSRACVLRLTHADGLEAVWEIEHGSTQCEAVKQLAAAMALTGESYRPEDEGSPPLLST
ncbi:hypothetical protein [Lysobacter auxotrophicus]|uniref:DUF2158 domain-containing protein n=1 Tax=Lysobacter auxotrophicus TaxID=2992573 RepID=A0ABM8DIG2_9GAMM|nr:hypothetical protein [Lysobacter auxotrophicus]BDU18435.1 hypothetical protein LA521A_36360 [Lysobacter auxotrophicus]